MSSALFDLGRTCYERRRIVVAVWLLVLALLGAGAGLFGKGTSENYSVPGSESQQTLDDLQGRFPEVAGTSAQIVAVAPQGSRVTDAGPRARIEDTVARLKGLDGVSAVTDPLSSDVSGAVSDDKLAAVISIQLDGSSQDVPAATTDGIVEDAARLRSQGFVAEAGGSAFGTQAPTMSWVEGLGLVLAALVLFLFFRSVRAAAAPIVAALATAATTGALLIASTAVIDLPGTAPLLALMLGIAVGIDYALFLLSRYRENLRGGVDGPEAAARATATAGSAVVFAGLTVITALLGLTIVGLPFLSAMGVSAAVGVAIAVAASLTLSPALMGFLGRRILGRRWGLPRRRAAAGRHEEPSDAARSDDARPAAAHDDAGSADAETGGSTAVRRDAAEAHDSVTDGTEPAEADGAEPRDAAASAPAKKPRSHVAHPRLGWADRWVRVVTRWPLVTVLLVTALLAIVAVPAKDLRLALPDNGTQPTTSSARQAYDLVDRYFGPGENGPLLVVADIVSSDDPVGVMNGLKTEIEKVPGVARVTLSTPNAKADTGVVVVVPTTGPSDPATSDLVQRLRDAAPALGKPYDVTLRVTGQTAIQIDVSDRLSRALLPFGLVVMGLSLLLLLVVFRSFVVPLTATLGFLLSTVAAFGVITAVFEWGWLGDQLGVARVGPVISFMPIILMGVLFGLAMDYQMFIVSRMHEHYVHHRDPRQAVLSGFASSAGVVASAAVIMVGVFAAFVPHGDASLKPIALGLAVGVFVDAFIVRMVFVPAALLLFGHAAWRLPEKLRAKLPHLDIEGEGVARQIAAEGVIAAHPDRIVHVRDLGIHGPRGVVVENFDLDVQAGTLCVLEAPEGGGKTSVLLALAGRMAFATGSADVAGYVLPDQARRVRRTFSLAEIPGVNGLDAELDVAQHISERFAAQSGLPWARRRQVQAELERFDEACAVAAAALGQPDPGRIDPHTTVADLTRVQRATLGVLLATIGSPRLVGVDDVDALRDHDETGLWAVIGWLIRAHPDLTVIATSQASLDADELARLTGLPHTAVQPTVMVDTTPAKVTS